MTLRLPDSLHESLIALAEREGVSLNHVVVYALTKATTAEFALQRRRTFEQLRTRFPKDVAEAALDRMLDERGPAPPDEAGSS